jgi:hypothetical protein
MMRPQLRCRIFNAAAANRSKFGDRTVDRVLGPAIDDDVGAFAKESRRDRVADAGGAAGDESQFAIELEVHDVSPDLCELAALKARLCRRRRLFPHDDERRFRRGEMQHGGS